MALNDDAKYPPVIQTQWGPVTERYRLQAAINMVKDPALKARMIAQFGEALLRKNYPEVFADEE